MNNINLDNFNINQLSTSNSNINQNNKPNHDTAPPDEIKNNFNNSNNSRNNSLLRLTYKKETLNFDEILEKRIGFGKYQYLKVFFLCLVDFNDGIELLSMSLILPVLKREWELESFWLEVISSVFYLGMLIGALITGKVSDIYGRRITILLASLLQFLITISFCFVNSVFILIVLRFFYGLIYGFSLPLSISMVSEIIPLKFRGKLIVLTNFCVSIGKIWGIFLAYLTFKNFTEGDWRLMMALCSITPLLVVIGMYFFVKESPRFLLSTRKYQKAFEVIDHIGFVNYENKKILFLNKTNNNLNLNYNNNHYTDQTSINNKNQLNRTTGYFNKNNIEDGKKSNKEHIKNSINFNISHNKSSSINNHSITSLNNDTQNNDNSPLQLNYYNKTSHRNNYQNYNSCNLNNITFDDDLEKFDNFPNHEISQNFENNINEKTNENDKSSCANANYLVTNTISDDSGAANNIFALKTNYLNLENNSEKLEEINVTEIYLKSKLKNRSLDNLEGFNSDYIPLSVQEKKSLINFYINSFKEEDSGNYKVLFRENIFPITIRLWICWFCLIFIEFGQYAILPFILISQKSGFGTLLLAILGEIPSIILSTLIIDRKNFGRKNSLSLFLLVLLVFNIIIYYSSSEFFGALISVERFFMKNSFSMLIPLTSELYPTNFRTIGYGFATGMGRVAATVCPYLLFPLFYWDPLSAFIVFALLSLVAFFASYTIPYETSGKYLDCILIDKNNG